LCLGHSLPPQYVELLSPTSSRRRWSNINMYRTCVVGWGLEHGRHRSLLVSTYRTLFAGSVDAPQYSKSGALKDCFLASWYCIHASMHPCILSVPYYRSFAACWRITYLTDGWLLCCFARCLAMADRRGLACQESQRERRRVASLLLCLSTAACCASPRLLGWLPDEPTSDERRRRRALPAASLS